jgi:asparagine synthase (glutamine-hydrolysing)
VCAIAGYLDLDRKRPARRDVVAAMAEVQRHRGPDDDGTYVAGPLALGFRRLSIVDIAGGRQPMLNEDGSIAMVCNGEIFDSDLLRDELERLGHRFASRCDVEVALHAYEQYGLAFLDRLEGQFALAVHDARAGRLVLARDRFGVCPLHVAVFGRTLVFASEIKGILAHPAATCRVDLTGLDQVFAFPGLVSPTTAFAGITALPPGHCAVVTDRLELRQYWDVEFPAEDGSPARVDEREYAERLEALLAAAVRRRLRADVPVGLYLSGGLDSALIGSFMVEHGARALPSFSITFPGAGMDESGHQETVARALGADHHAVPFDWRRLADGLRPMVRHAECPVKETYNVCVASLSAAARSCGVPVVFGGEGADELFAGYVGYRFDAAGRRGDDLDDGFEAAYRERLWGDRDFAYETRFVAMRELLTSLYSAEVNAARPDFDCLDRVPIDRARLRGRHPVNRRSYLDLKLRLADHLIGDHGDRMAMANGVEVRYPFLDRELVEFVATVPPDLKLRGLQEKYLLKRVAAGRVPRPIVMREKFGFHAPGSPELLKGGAEWIGDMLSPARIRRQGYFDPAAVSAVRDAYMRPGFRLDLPFETDVLLVVLTFGILLDEFSPRDLHFDTTQERAS